MQSARTILSFVACPALQNFPTLPHKRHNYRKKKVIEHKMCFDFLRNLFKTFVILRRIRRDVTINVHRSSYKLAFILADFNENWILSTDFRKYLKYKISLKSVQWEPSCSLRMGRQTDGQKWRSHSRFSQFCECAHIVRCGFCLSLRVRILISGLHSYQTYLIFCCMPSGFLLCTD